MGWRRIVVVWVVVVGRVHWAWRRHGLTVLVSLVRVVVHAIINYLNLFQNFVNYHFERRANEKQTNNFLISSV